MKIWRSIEREAKEKLEREALARQIGQAPAPKTSGARLVTTLREEALAAQADGKVGLATVLRAAADEIEFLRGAREELIEKVGG